MNKKDYVDAMNEIKPEENLKRETYNKITNSQKRRYIRFYPVATLALMVAIVVGIGLPMQKKDIILEEQLSQQKVANTMELPKIGSFENLYAMLGDERYESYMKNMNGLIIETDSELAATNDAVNGATSNSNKENSTSEYSRTNNQVEGVDEADIVKTDGRYIYYRADGKIVIVSIDDLKVVSTIENEDDNDIYLSELYVEGDKLVVIGTKTIYEKRDDSQYDIDISYTYYSSAKTFTIAKVYNIANREKPELERTIEVEGSYLSSRRIDDNIYLMTNKYIPVYNFINAEAIDDLKGKEEEFSVQYTDTVVGKETQCMRYEDMYYIPDSVDTNYLNIASFNINNNEKAQIDSYLGAGGTVYASQNSIYAASQKCDYKGKSYSIIDITTVIYKFELKDGKCVFSNTGEVPGSVLNQFSMDEKDGYFRIATTDRKTWNSNSEKNNLYVLDENLEIVGKVTNLAKGEKIYSVRFMGDRAYMVTFVETDPLFVIDLSDPKNPEVLGELKIPGYSKYLHPYDENHIIGFGEKTKIVNYGYGDQVITDGMKMALFDVTEPENPQELYSVDLGEKGTSSELLYNHKSLLFSKEKNIIAFPISQTRDNYEVEFQGAVVYGLDLEKGFELKGKISHMEDNYDRYLSANNVNRIVYVDNVLYTLSNGIIKATDMTTMKELNSLEL